MYVCRKDRSLASVRLVQKETKVTEESVLQTVDLGLQDGEVMTVELEDLDYLEHPVRRDSTVAEEQTEKLVYRVCISDFPTFDFSFKSKFRIFQIREFMHINLALLAVAASIAAAVGTEWTAPAFGVRYLGIYIDGDVSVKSLVARTCVGLFSDTVTAAEHPPVDVR